MNLTRILAIPFTLVADVVTLGNMGGRSFTEQVFDAERAEQYNKAAAEYLRILSRLPHAQTEGRCVRDPVCNE